MFILIQYSFIITIGKKRVQIKTVVIVVVVMEWARPVAGGGGCTGCVPPPPTGPNGAHFGTQGPTFRVQSVKVKDGFDDMFSLWNSIKEEINLFIEHVQIVPILQSNLRLNFQRMKLHSSKLPIFKNDLSLTFRRMTIQKKVRGRWVDIEWSEANGTKSSP